jgi:hypothetical protein
MKTITVNVSEPVYVDFQRYAEQQDRATSELIREAMENYRQTKIHPVRTLRDSRPASVQTVLKPWTGRAELLDDLLETNARD